MQEYSVSKSASYLLCEHAVVTDFTIQTKFMKEDKIEFVCNNKILQIQ